MNPTLPCLRSGKAMKLPMKKMLIIAGMLSPTRIQLSPKNTFYLPARRPALIHIRPSMTPKNPEIMNERFRLPPLLFPPPLPPLPTCLREKQQECQCWAKKLTHDSPLRNRLNFPPPMSRHSSTIRVDRRSSPSSVCKTPSLVRETLRHHYYRHHHLFCSKATSRRMRPNPELPLPKTSCHGVMGLSATASS